MLKKLFNVNLLLILVLNVNFLIGFDHSLDLSNQVVRCESDWEHLLSEGHEIDLKAAALAQKKLKGWRYDQELHAVIPADFKQTDKEWKKTKDHIAHVIGPLPNHFDHDVRPWENSAKNVEDLLQDAAAMAPFFKDDFEYIASLTETNAHFGPHDRNITKTRESLMNKARRDAHTLGLSEEEAISKIGDAIRGTLILHDIFQIPVVIAELINYADYRDAQVNFKNLWTEERESGYVGIHAKFLLPLRSVTLVEEERYILAEMQIHLYPIADGTSESVKEREHLIYEQVRLLENFNHLKRSAASKLLFLTAMQDILKELDRK